MTRQLSSVVLGPLQGYVVGVTADRRWQEQAELLRRRGASVVHGPTIATLYLASELPLRAATTGLIDQPPDYLIASTGIGVRAWWEAAQAWGLSSSLAAALSNTRIAARGPKAASAVAATGLPLWRTATTERLDEVIAAVIADGIAGRRVAVQEHGAASPDVLAALTAAGAEVVAVPVYRWRLPDDTTAAEALIEAACEHRLDAVTFTTGPAVHNLVAIAERMGLAEPLREALNSRVTVACVGPVCAESARRVGIDSLIQPETGRLGLLVRTLSDHMASRSRRVRLVTGEVTMQGSALDTGHAVLDLPHRERELLAVLMERPGAVVSTATILTRVWGSGSTDRHLVTTATARLRSRLGTHAAAVQSIRGRGYRLDCA